MKLSEPQKRLLDEACSKGSINCADTYPPARKLVELGLARWETIRFAKKLVPTDKGRAANV